MQLKNSHMSGSIQYVVPLGLIPTMLTLTLWNYKIKLHAKIDRFKLTKHWKWKEDEH